KVEHRVAEELEGAVAGPTELGVLVGPRAQRERDAQERRPSKPVTQSPLQLLQPSLCLRSRPVVDRGIRIGERLEDLGKTSHRADEAIRVEPETPAGR